jgi:hypothetical protein
MRKKMPDPFPLDPFPKGHIPVPLPEYWEEDDEKNRMKMMISVMYVH